MRFKMAGKTIQIYLPDGNPKGVKKASITTDKIEIFPERSFQKITSF